MKKVCILLVIITDIYQNVRFKSVNFSAPKIGKLDLDNFEETLTEVYK